MKTTDLGLPENLEKLNYVVGKICGLNVFIYKEPKKHICKLCSWSWDIDCVNYSPAVNASQCLEATPKCIVTNRAGMYLAVIGEWGEGNIEGKKLMAYETELIARCLALVYSEYGDNVPDSVFKGK